jgi:ADP-ribose diphosphatase
MGYELIEKQVIFEGRKARLEVHHLRDEQSGRKLHREIVVHTGAVCVLPFVDENTVMLIRQKRYAIGQIIVEIPAGTLEKNEPPMNCAGRELLEETGYLAGRIQPIGTFYTSPGILTEKMYAFSAHNLEQQKQALEEGEEIELMKVSYDEAIEMCRNGDIADGKTIATILLYDRFARRK